eukprot:1815796-Rhodomonas_salina.1
MLSISQDAVWTVDVRELVRACGEEVSAPGIAEREGRLSVSSVDRALAASQSFLRGEVRFSSA